MRIKKISPTTPANGNIENQYGTSQTNAYSQAYINNATAPNSTKWGNKEQDWATENNLDTWIPVLKDTKMQHTTISSLVKRGIKTINVSGTPDSNGFIATGLNLNNIVLGVANTSANGAFYIPFISKQENRITVQCTQWNGTPVTSQTSFTVYYIEI
jgi:hypothetical protein